MHVCLCLCACVCACKPTPAFQYFYNIMLAINVIALATNCLRVSIKDQGNAVLHNNGCLTGCSYIANQTEHISLKVRRCVVQVAKLNKEV